MAPACSKCGAPVGPGLFRCVERSRSGCPFDLRRLRPTQASAGCVVGMGLAVLAVGTWVAFLMARGLHGDHWLAIAVQALFAAFVLLLGLLLLLGGLYGPLGRIRLAIDARAGTAFCEGRLFGIAVERTVLVAGPSIPVPEWRGNLPASLAWLPGDDPGELSRTVEEALQAARVRDPLARSRYEKKGREGPSQGAQLVATALLSLAAGGGLSLRRVDRETAWSLRRKTRRKAGVHVAAGRRAGDVDGLLERKLLSTLVRMESTAVEPFGPSVSQVVEALFPSLVADPGRDLVLEARREARARGLVREVKGRDVPHPPLLQGGLMVKIAAWIEDRISFWVEEPGAAGSLRAERETLAALRDAAGDVDPKLLADLEEEVRAGLAARESSD